jgi:hypothetical protein
MKRIKSLNKNVLLALVWIFAGSTISAQQSWRTVENNAFQPGERIQLRFYYDAWLTGKVTAGIGVAEVKETSREFYGRPVIHIDTEGYSKGLFHFFYKVRDEFDSYLDKEFLAPHLFVRQTREGGFQKFDEYRFNHEEEYVVTHTDSMSIPRYTQDFVSAVYFARTFNSDTMKPGDLFYVNFFIDDSVYNSAVFFEGRETVEIKLGTFKCLRLKPMMAVGEVFTERYPMTLWVTDDKNHLPILAKSAVFVGNVKMELMEYSGLANELTSLVELNE